MSIANFIVKLNTIKSETNIENLSLEQIKQKLETNIQVEISEERKPKKKKKRGKGSKSIRVVTWYSDESDNET